jgi:hypothetical protein
MASERTEEATDSAVEAASEAAVAALLLLEDGVSDDRLGETSCFSDRTTWAACSAA